MTDLQAACAARRRAWSAAVLPAISERLDAMARHHALEARRIAQEAGLAVLGSGTAGEATQAALAAVSGETANG